VAPVTGELPEVRLPEGCLVVLVGVPGSGKSTWAARVAEPNQIVSSDALRAQVGLHQRDQRASKDAFDLLDRIVGTRLRRGLTTIVDTTGLEAPRRAGWVAAARKSQRRVHAVVLDVPSAEARRRNKARPDPVPSKILTSQLAALPAAVEALATEGFDAVHHLSGDEVVSFVPGHFVTAPALAQIQQEDPVPLRFALHLGRFAWPGGGPQLRENLRRVATAAEEAGFDAISVMDHVVQIPGVGPEWEDIPDSTTTLAFLASCTERVQLGALVHGITYRNLAQLGKQVATLDVLSGGRAFCGLGAAWHQRDHHLYGWGELPPVARRYDLLEDALELFPLLWGPGAPRFEGRTVTVPEAICYPRPLQDRIPIVVGGSGERRTLRLAARFADACNLFGGPDAVRHKVSVLHAHCEIEGRDPSDVTVTQLSEAAVIDRGGDRYSDAVGTVEEQVGRFRALADAGVQQVFLALHEDGTTAQIERFSEVIRAFA
jgi:alkanesulfonate monooxygenase SsuD/methylene tetrahydromethanopterin reductase-like flavin-dependent oxidoreductase (luciferase family)/predicted kinase